MPGQFESLICHSPTAFEEAHFEAAYLPIAVAFDVVVRLVGSVAPVAPEAVFAAAPAAAGVVSADHLRTRPKQSPPMQHLHPRAGRKASQEQRQGTTQANMTS